MWNSAQMIRLGHLRTKTWIQTRVTRYVIHSGRNGSGTGPSGSLFGTSQLTAILHLLYTHLATAVSWQRMSHLILGFKIGSEFLTLHLDGYRVGK